MRPLISLQADVFAVLFMNNFNKVTNLTNVLVEKFGKLVDKQNCSYIFLFYFINFNIIIVQVRYITIETKEVAHIGYNGFLYFFRMSTNAEKETCYIQYWTLLLFQ